MRLTRASDLLRAFRFAQALFRSEEQANHRAREPTREGAEAYNSGALFGFAVEPVKLESYVSPPISPSTHWSLDPVPVRRGSFWGMDGDLRRLKQHDQQAHDETPRGESRRSVSRSSGSMADRFRQAGFNSTRGDPSQATGRPRMPAYMDYGYTESPIQGGALPEDELQPYPPTLRDHQQRQQPFAPYESDLVYNLGQQGPTQTPYEVVPQYSSRQSASLDSLAGQFPVPQYFAPNEPSGTGLSSPYLPSGLSPSAYNQPGPIGRSSATQPFPATMADMASVGAAGQQQALSLSQPQALSETQSATEPYRQFQLALRRTFNHIGAGRLVEASRSLLDISEWLVASARELGTYLVSLLASKGLPTGSSSDTGEYLTQ